MKKYLLLTALVFNLNISFGQKEKEYSFPDVYFFSGTSNYKFINHVSDQHKDTTDVLLDIATYIEKNKNYIYRINGCVNSNEDKSLGLLRAQKVTAFLISKGIPSEILQNMNCETKCPKFSSFQMKKAKSKIEKEEMNSRNSRVFISVVKKA